MDGQSILRALRWASPEHDLDAFDPALSRQTFCNPVEPKMSADPERRLSPAEIRNLEGCRALRFG
jgi:hypothetical protein